jgi:hypothetical protein
VQGVLAATASAWGVIDGEKGTMIKTDRSVITSHLLMRPCKPCREKSPWLAEEMKDLLVNLLSPLVKKKSVTHEVTLASPGRAV